MTSRRKFLKNGTLGALAAGCTLGLSEQVGNRALAATALSAEPMGLNRAAFASQLQTTFSIIRGSRQIPLKLIDVVEIGSRKSAGGVREAFALVLRGGHDSPLKQETYSIHHEKLGNFSFLVVPVVSRDKSARYYEININRLHG